MSKWKLYDELIREIPEELPVDECIIGIHGLGFWSSFPKILKKKQNSINRLFPQLQPSDGLSWHSACSALSA